MKKLMFVFLAVAVLAILVTGAAFAASSGAAGADQALAAADPAEGQGWLGISVVDITERIAERLKLSQTSGIVVATVVPNSPAATAGVKMGDILTAVNDVAVETAQEAVAEARKSKAGDTVTLSISRAKESLSLKVTAGELPKRAAPQPRQPLAPKGEQGLTPDEQFARNLGSVRTYKDKDGAVKTLHTIPGIVTAVSSTSITITPNNTQSRGGPFTIDGATRIAAANRRVGSNAIAVNDKVIVVVQGDSTHADAITKWQPVPTKRFQFQMPQRFDPRQRNFQLPKDFLRRLLPQQPAAPGQGA